MISLSIHAWHEQKNALTLTQSPTQPPNKTADPISKEKTSVEIHSR